jgi:aminoglycoside phosphotransferase (APT) family kinase protein
LDINCVLQLAFGRLISTTPIPLPLGQHDGGLAYALHGKGVPPRVILLRYRPRLRAQAFRAFTVMRVLRDRQFPVPDVYYMGWSYYTRYVLLLVEYVEGRSEEGMPHAFFARVGTDFAHTLARLHLLRWDPLPDLAMLPFRYAFHELAEEVRRYETPQLQEILEWLVMRVGHITELPYTLVHGNYTLQNALAERTRIIAVQGWEQAALADPRFDVGYTSAVLGSFGIALSDQFLEAYSAVAGELPDRVFWEVFSALRLLTRVARSISTLREPQRQRFLERVGPSWQGLLQFVERRSGLRLIARDLPGGPGSG